MKRTNVIMLKIFTDIVEWTLKLLMAWLFYHLSVWMGLSEWAVIAIVAVAAVETKLNIEWKSN